MVRADLPKVSPPQLDRIAPRPRVAAVLGEAARRGVVWVQGPGGCGKTTAVALVAASARRPVLWLHLDGGDAHPESFFHYLARAAGGAARRGTPALPVYDPALQAELALFARRFARALLERAAASGFALVFDNAHDVPDDSPVHEAIAAMGEELTPRATVFVLSRQPPAQAYAALLGRGQLQPVAPEALAFTRMEMDRALRERGVQDEARLAGLWQQSGGWIAGALLLALQPGETAPGKGEAAAEGGLVFNYLARQLFPRIPAEDRELLLRTAFLLNVTAGGAERLSGIADSGARLARLAAAGHFTVQLATDPPQFRYHDLLRAFLKVEATRRLDVAGLQALLKASAAEMLAGGEPLPALELLAQAQAWDEFRDAAVAHAESVVSAGDSRALVAALGRLPEHILREEPWLLYWLGQCQLSLDDDQAIGSLVSAYEVFESRNDPAGQLAASADLPATIMYRLSDSAEYATWFSRFAALAEDESLRTGLSPYQALKVSAALVSCVTASAGLRAHVDELIARLMKLVPVAGGANLRMQALGAVVYLAWALRRDDLAPPAIAMAEEGRFDERASPLVVLHWLYDVITFHAMYGDAARARLYGERAERLAEEIGLPQSRYEATLLRLEAACDANDVALAETLVESLVRRANPSRLVAQAGVSAMKGRIALMKGDWRAALGESDRAMALLDQAGHPKHRRSSYYQIEVGAFALAGDWDAALAAADRYHSAFNSDGQEIVQVNTAWVRAGQAIDRGDPEGRALLADAVATAQRLRYPLFFRHANAVAARLCEQALAWGIEPAYIAGVIAHRGLKPTDPDSPRWPWPVRVRCLGGFEVEVAGSAAPPLGKQQKPAQLLQVLVALGGRDVPVAGIIDLLWPGEGRVGAHQAFDTTLHRLRKLLGSDTAITYADRQVGINGASMWVDALALDAHLGRLEGQIEAGALPDAIAGELHHLTSLYRGHFLPNAGDVPWATGARDRLWTRLRRAMLAYAQAAARAGDTERALQTYYFVADQDPLAEDAFFGLMVTYSSRGQNAEALRAFERCAFALKAQLGTAPSERLRTLAAALRSG